jgi:L-alanine-DL-glutamate epimerase-like enolase superfamily enzyme
LREQNVDDGLAHGLATQRLFAETIASVECELRGDQLHLPDGPGLGVEIDESALAHHRL